MKADPASLDRLHDIVVPGPAPWWPPAPGWLWVLAVVAVLVLALLLRGIVHWQKNRYRREALAELARLEAAAASGPPWDDALAGLSELLKRTALTAYPREEVAALTGPPWFAFLDRSAGTRFAAGLGAVLEQSTYGERDPAWNAARTRELTTEVRAWIKQHGRVVEAEMP